MSATVKQKPFAFSADNKKKIKEIIAKYPQGRQASAVLALLDLAQRQAGWVSQSAIETIAKILEMPSIRVHEVATFYTMVHLNPVGKYHFQLCGTTPCMLCGAQKLKDICEQEFKVKHKGQVSSDGLFSLEEVECLGACVNAPVIQINDDYYEDLNPDSLKQIITDLRSGKNVKPGSKIGRHSSEPLGFVSDDAPKKHSVKRKGVDDAGK